MDRNKRYAFERLQELNKGAHLSISNDGFIWALFPKDQNLVIPQKYMCPEGLDIWYNTTTLRHIYNSKGDFVVTVIARK